MATGCLGENISDAFSWEQVGRLQQIRAGYEALHAKQTIYYVQAMDKATDARILTREETEAALKQVNMNTTGYLLGMLPLYVGMPARISAILSTRGLNRELPCVVKKIVLHPREERLPSSLLANDQFVCLRICTASVSSERSVDTTPPDTSKILA